MSPTILRPVLLALLIGTGIHCKHDNALTPTPTPTSTFTGKLVINAPCGNFVIQVLSGPIDSVQLVKSWKDTANDSVYTNVFTVANKCGFPQYGLVQGDVFTFKLVLPPRISMDNCLLCMVYYPTPSISYPVTSLGKVNN